ncbi:MAG: DUF4830 domain-containing protein [Acutalibacteraceae bacterium]|nr:DUF4830 domain-containing protein [Acutalibacteraceae bacterium]
MYIIKRITKGSVAAVLIIVFMLLLVILRITSMSDATTAYCDAVGKYSTAISEEFSTVDFLAQFGIQVSKESEQAAKVTIPSEFNRVYENYNALQQSQGLSLEDYKGKVATKYTYSVTNSLPDTDVSCNIIVCENKVIAGDLCTAELNGAMTALTDKTLLQSESST